MTEPKNHSSAGKSLADVTAQKIIQYIISNKLDAGARLPNEQQLIELFKVGRSTLREAVRTLSSRNILDVRHGSGIYVSQTPGVAEDPLGLAFERDQHKMIIDLVNFRMMFEPKTASLAAQYATPEQVDELYTLMLQVEAKLNIGEPHIEEDAAFHAKIAELSGNLILPKLSSIIYQGISVFITTTEAQNIKETIDSHRAIYNAIKEHNGMAAADAMSMHIFANRLMIARKLKDQTIIDLTNP